MMSHIKKYLPPGKLRASYLVPVANPAKVLPMDRGGLCKGLALSFLFFFIIASINELKAGELVFFKSEKANRITHVGIYIGNGNFIHASKGKRGVAVSSLSDEYFKNHFAGARRVLNRLDSSIRMKQDKEQAPGPQNKSET